MRRNYRYLVFLLLVAAFHITLPACAAIQYTGVNGRIISPGNTGYYVDAAKGDDANTGTSRYKAWKTLKQVNSRIFSAGDRITIIGPAEFKESLFLVARGNSEKHIKLTFLKGTYDFYTETSFKRQFFISNTNDDAYTPKAIAIYIDSSRYVDIEAGGAKMVMRGKMIETCIDHSENIIIHGATYDYHRPTVSELQVLKTGDNFAELKIHPDSKYSIKDSMLTWEGESWRYNSISLWQVFNPATGNLQRTNINMDGLKYAETGNNLVRVYFKSNPGFKTGLIYQNRDITRDCTGIFLLRSKNLRLKNVHINFMHGMGVVSQFCQNITIDSVFVRPALNSGRTSAAWADVLHFSGCRGKIVITNSYLSGANDDAVNIHGTYLRIINKPLANQLLVRFMHNQTFGFEAFEQGDSIALIHAKSLLQYGTNVVSRVEKINDKDVLLTFKKPVTETMELNDVIENVTWTPEVYIAHDTIARIPTRGVLVTTRRKAIIEKNVFEGTNNSAISIADDAASWYESGMISNLLIRYNKFNLCGEPAIVIAPENTQSSTQKVHNHIVITQNIFNLSSPVAIAAKSSADISVVNNYFNLPGVAVKETDIVKFEDCADIHLSGNKISVKK
ncbi:right-handed parallel beta-helix repeat-containing protein [Mucilaginibacter sp. FT3.2]|uniref:alpha-1,3-galactosidase-related protein n=1 Tax=Mucilaginibacter sp. FT3.2 TaxID=2723090 RepID=UPI001620FEE9|nr:right-handed parallel beta-helix repeat-containing protein [Mucilaginibacter sp. FT3.2]MBB6230289.1 hypothetical protein [Mucilaginibacter sp. FT3.2]